ncbi:hypothetical protein J2T23_001653 [Pseudarthrobacter niigatensis]|uniref:Uncharacterized protein n=1 Tax=Pseudarthrobacter niigatensis TaxID=369935 RepID=A0AAJ1SW15_9MICC|nr:hypothetical protein [Pseudarthrobacter niigatensis]MDQ0265615.1 hypothetical protein [Pseudarthrobacter niigatensis]
MDLNINKKEIRPQIRPARIHNDITNLPGVIEIVRAHNPKSTAMVLMRRNCALSTQGDHKLKLAHRGLISGRG